MILTPFGPCSLHLRHKSLPQTKSFPRQWPTACHTTFLSRSSLPLEMGTTTRTHFGHGGDLVHWDSMESAADFALVSKAWLDAGVFALYRSISIIGEEAAELFLRTIRARPERAALVRSLVIGLLADEEADAEAESNKVLEVLEACTFLTSLQVRPLHPAVRHRVLSAIQAKRLTSLVCLPRCDNNNDTESLYRSTDLLEFATPSLFRLEVDFWAPDHLGLFTPHPLPSFPPLALVDFRSFSSGSNAVVLNILTRAGPTLENIIVYFENLFPEPRVIADALATSANTLRTLSFVSDLSPGLLSALRIGYCCQAEYEPEAEPQRWHRRRSQTPPSPSSKASTIRPSHRSSTKSCSCFSVSNPSPSLQRKSPQTPSASSRPLCATSRFSRSTTAQRSDSHRSSSSTFKITRMRLPSRVFGYRTWRGARSRSRL